MNDLSEFVVLTDTTLTTDSRRVAKHFQKRHDSVLRAFDAMKCSDKYRLHHYVEVVEARQNPSGGAPLSSRVVQMTKNGFVLLVMGFTGEQAMKVKEEYINAFDAMAEQLQKIGNSLWAQRLDLEKREATSFMWASFGGKCMVKRRQEKPLLDNERSLLEDQMQPALFKGDTPSLTH